MIFILRISVLSMLLFWAVGQSMNAQCDTFLPGSCKSALGDYVHDGNKNSALLSEGETAELFKTFHAGETYRLVICKADNLPPVHVRVVDNAGRVLFDNKNFNYEQVWDFSVRSTQVLVVQMKVLSTGKVSGVKKNGCVSVIFGMEHKS